MSGNLLSIKSKEKAVFFYPISSVVNVLHDYHLLTLLLGLLMKSVQIK